MNNETQSKNAIRKRFNGYLPIVVDVETSGVDASKHALLEIAATIIVCDDAKNLITSESFATHVEPFEGAKMDPKAMEIHRIDPYHPFRFAISEKAALEQLFLFANKALKETGCRRAVLVGHNAHFDLGFIRAAMRRHKINEGPFHSFTCFDTASLSALMFGKTVLAQALKTAKIPYDKNKAHSAIYDVECTALLFCHIVNKLALANAADN